MLRTYLRESGEPSQIKVPKEMGDGAIQLTNATTEAKCTFTSYLGYKEMFLALQMYFLPLYLRDMIYIH